MYMQIHIEGHKTYTSVYLIIFEDFFKKIIFMLVLLLLLPNDASHLELLEFKYILSSRVFLHQFFHLFIF